MTPDSALIAFSSLGFASVFLALVIGIRDQEPGDIAASLAELTPSARKQARFAHLDYLTNVADQAIEARQLGKRLKMDHEGL